mmetsp:Transcript_56062/g.156188  ORF Transcript_56062/g.156188 Transcript_56062/m.156188 type:complete len:571 (-) Transcript_56062:427-2139(-)
MKRPLGATEDRVADELAGRGFSVQQLLTFFTSKPIDMNMTTNAVVKNIVIPETAGGQTDYMNSPFMRGIGGPQRAAKIVSHAWKSRFAVLVLNILLDATGLTLQDLEEAIDTTVWNPFSHKHFFEVALKKLDASVLSLTYWLCIFAINQHFSICGTCWICNPQTSEELRKPVCGCGKPKFNPCSCGALKWKRGDELFELDKFEQVVKRMRGQVVSVDSDLATLTRIWVVAEINEARKSLPVVVFRAAYDLGSQAQAKLLQGEPVIPPVAQCEASDPEDKRMILDSIPSQADFDDFVWSYVEVCFGMFGRLSSIGTGAKTAFARIVALHIDCAWNKQLCSTSEMSFGNCEAFQGLRRLDVSFKNLEQLTDISSLATGIRFLNGLQQLKLDFENSALTDACPLGQAIGDLRELRQLTLNFRGCRELADISSLGNGVAVLQGLEQLTLDFEACPRHSFDITTLGQGLKCLKALKQLTLKLGYCRVSNITSLGEALTGLRSLQRLVLDFRYCHELADVSVLREGLRGLGPLRQFTLNLTGCGDGVPAHLSKEWRACHEFLRASSQTWLGGCVQS